MFTCKYLHVWAWRFVQCLCVSQSAITSAKNIKAQQKQTTGVNKMPVLSICQQSPDQKHMLQLLWFTASFVKILWKGFVLVGDVRCQMNSLESHLSTSFEQRGTDGEEWIQNKLKHIQCFDWNVLGSCSFFLGSVCARTWPQVTLFGLKKTGDEF